MRVDKRLAVLAIVAAFALTGCGSKARLAEMQNVRPPAAGTPDGPASVSGIYRTLRSATLQLRSDGKITMIIPQGDGASSGRFTLQQGRFEMQTSNCGEVAGSYDVTVTGEQKAGKATLVITEVDDPCQPRLRDLTSDPWVYSDS